MGVISALKESFGKGRETQEQKETEEDFRRREKAKQAEILRYAKTREAVGPATEKVGAAAQVIEHKTRGARMAVGKVAGGVAYGAGKTVGAAGSAVRKLKESETYREYAKAARERRRVEIRKQMGLRVSGLKGKERMPRQPQVIVIGGGGRQRVPQQPQEAREEHPGIFGGGYHGGMLGGNGGPSGEVGMFSQDSGKKKKGRSGLTGAW